MAIFAQQNQYYGINAHLNSYLQNAAGTWVGFHSRYMGFLASYLDKILPAGYYTATEQSLQNVPLAEVSAPNRIDPISYLLEDDEAENFLVAIVIHEMATHFPVCRIELLSPTNKPHRSGFREYKEKRVETLRAGTPLIEIDFLHQSPPIYQVMLMVILIHLLT